MKKIISIIAIFVCAFTFTSVIAGTKNIVRLTKVTTLTKHDASGFAKTFGTQVTGNRKFHFTCEHNQCKIVARVGGFKGKIAEELLKGRDKAKFVSKDHKFILNCGHTRVAFCNVIQKHAILTT